MRRFNTIFDFYAANSMVFIDLNLNKAVSELIQNAATDFVGTTKEKDGSYHN